MVARIDRLKACLNGRRAVTEHPAVPVTPAQLADAARAAVAAGAEAVHMHPRGSDGRETLLASDVGAAVAAVRGACPQTPIGVTTGLWAAGDPAVRHEQVSAWASVSAAQRPDFASVNIGEDGSVELAAALAAMGIEPEAGVWTVADADVIAGNGPAGGWLRIMVEISGVSASGAVPAADLVLARLAETGPGAPVLLHGENESCWPLVAHAGRLGLATRVGLEDVTAGPSGQPVAGNADLVTLGLEIWRDAAANRGG